MLPSSSVSLAVPLMHNFVLRVQTRLLLKPQRSENASVLVGAICAVASPPWHRSARNSWQEPGVQSGVIA